MRNLKCIVLSVLVLFVPMAALAGDLDSPAAPASTAGAMYTLEAIYDRLDAGTAGAKRAGAFTEPSAGPTAGTGHTLDDVMGKAPSVDSANGAGLADVLSGKTFWGLTSGAWGTKTGAMTNNGAGTTITPGTSNHTVDAGYWSSANTVSGDTDLAAGNIKDGVVIFGVTGTFPSDGTAVEGEVKTGSTFYTSTATRLTGSGTKTLSADNDTVTAGYYAATTLSAVDTDLAAGNIKSGVTIFGVAGSALSSEVAKTGQTTFYATGDDGDLEKGVAWPNPRFTDNADGTVTDNLTGLMWLKNANNAGGTKNWADALTYCNDLDDSGYDDWRLPNVKELQSLIDYGFYNPALSDAEGTAKWTTDGDAFSSVQSNSYWSSTTYAGITANAWIQNLNSGSVLNVDKTLTYYVWPVRVGQ